MSRRQSPTSPRSVLELMPQLIPESQRWSLRIRTWNSSPSPPILHKQTHSSETETVRTRLRNRMRHECSCNECTKIPKSSVCEAPICKIRRKLTSNVDLSNPVTLVTNKTHLLSKTKNSTSAKRKSYRKRNTFASSTPEKEPLKPYKCQHCDKRFMSSTSRTTHERIHTGIMPFSCYVCSRKFRHYSSYRYHTGKHESENPTNEGIKKTTHAKRFQCCKCDKTFISNQLLSRHEEYHKAKKNSKNTIVCRICEITFRSLKTLRDHMKNKHEDGPVKRHAPVPNRFCELCNQHFKNNYSFKFHLAVHSGKGRECRFCCKIFYDLTNLKVHERIHTGERPYICSVCNKGFAQQSTLRGHYNAHEKASKVVEHPASIQPRIIKSKAKRVSVVKQNCALLTESNIKNAGAVDNRHDTGNQKTLTSAKENIIIESDDIIIRKETISSEEEETLSSVKENIMLESDDIIIRKETISSKEEETLSSVKENSMIESDHTMIKMETFSSDEEETLSSEEETVSSVKENSMIESDNTMIKMETFSSDEEETLSSVKENSMIESDNTMIKMETFSSDEEETLSSEEETVSSEEEETPSSEEEETPSSEEETVSSDEEETLSSEEETVSSKEETLSSVKENSMIESDDTIIKMETFSSDEEETLSSEEEETLFSDKNSRFDSDIVLKEEEMLPSEEETLSNEDNSIFESGISGSGKKVTDYYQAIRNKQCVFNFNSEVLSDVQENFEPDILLDAVEEMTSANGDDENVESVHLKNQFTIRTDLIQQFLSDVPEASNEVIISNISETQKIPKSILRSSSSFKKSVSFAENPEIRLIEKDNTGRKVGDKIDEEKLKKMKIKKRKGRLPCAGAMFRRAQVEIHRKLTLAMLSSVKSKEETVKIKEPEG